MDVPAEAATRRFLTFNVNERLYALSADQVQEIMRVPAVARVPQSPAALLGLANLRGAVLPVVAVHALLGRQASPGSSACRAIVLSRSSPAALVVDSVGTLEVADSEHIDTRSKELGAEAGEHLLGVVKIGADRRAARLLDIETLLKRTFSSERTDRQPDRQFKAAARDPGQTSGAGQTEKLVTFEVAGQEFAFHLEQVAEILPAPAAVTPVSHAEAVVLGLSTLRDSLLPLFSLRTLLGLPPRAGGDEREKVVVVKLGAMLVGLVTDRVRAVIAAEPKLVDPVPAALSSRVGGEARIHSIYRGEGGRRLISILSPEHLFREDVMQRLLASRPTDETAGMMSGAAHRQEVTFLVFRLADDEYGLPIDAVVEVTRVPEQITRVPKTPKFLEGLANLRGEVLPVVDQRRRFDMPLRDRAEGGRLIVVMTERHRAGLIVDGVSEVLRSDADSVKPAPQLTEETSRLVRGVINPEASSRIVLILDPTELLTRAERALLDKFKAERRRVGA